MTVTISLPPETEARLLAQATATGKDMPTLIREAIEEKFAGANGAGSAASHPAEDFDRALDECFAANPEKLPSLPVDFSRADIYADHE